QKRAVDAAKEALASPLLDVSIDGAKGVLFNVVSGSSLTLFEVNEAAEVIRQAVDNEANNGLSNVTGTLAMARTSAPHSATSQFFINLKDNHFLDHRDKTDQGWGYAVFGRVTEGMEIINQIKQCDTTTMAGHQDVPVKEVIIESTEITEAD
ncbi:MAG: peptidylprolyl isomerase, partial [Proteobacteria bacterium]|nr:peptidylprolyl isomerase [Pseudomonadota bacterium]